MPGPDGKLTPIEKSKLVDWLNEKTKLTPNCPVCNTNNWNVGDHLLNSMVFHGGGNMVIGGPTYPMAFMACANCQYVRTFMAVPIGIVSATPPPKPDKPSGE